MTAVTPRWEHGRVRCADAVHCRFFDDELVILDLGRGEYFALDEIGARLWSALEAGRTVEEVAKDIVAQYDVSMDRVVNDLVVLGNELVARGLLVSEKRADTRADTGGVG